MNKIRFIQTDMRALWFIRPSGIKKYYPSPASYQRLEQTPPTGTSRKLDK